jgi:hypothetical protein
MNFDQPEFDHHLRASLNFYNYYHNQKDLKKYLVDWAKNSGKYTKEQLGHFIRGHEKLVSMTACGIAKAHSVGMPLRERHIAYLHSEVMDAIKNTAPEALEEAKPVEKPKVYTPTIQDRLAERTSEIIGELEGMYDAMLENTGDKFLPYEFLTANNVVQSQLGKYEALYNARRAELQSAQAKEDEQLVEGYKHLKAADYKRIYAWMDQLLAAIEQYRGVKKATKKARVKKAPSKEKLIGKMKYAKEHKPLKLVSINPADILGAQELWVFNTKTRKLGRYTADSHHGSLSVKGTSIVGYDEVQSVCKTLRKPEAQIPELMKASKPNKRKFMSTIKATEVKLNGRISEDVVLLLTL